VVDVVRVTRAAGQKPGTEEGGGGKDGRVMEGWRGNGGGVCRWEGRGNEGGDGVIVMAEAQQGDDGKMRRQGGGYRRRGRSHL